MADIKIDFEEISFKIIAFSGEAKALSINSISEAKNGKFKEAEEMLEKAEKSMIEAEKTHMDVVTAEAGGQKFQLPVLFIHAEDQLLTTQTIMLLAKEFIDIYKKIK